MQPLAKNLRSQLESTVKQARQLAESAARAALEELGVGEAAPPSHLNDKQRDLRRRLRVHGRQLGDSLNGGKVQSMERLVEEVAYEHWHRMLFARFLAENNLLMYPDPGGSVAVSLEECEELAADEGAANGWELAARFAGQMLPQIFRVDSPVFALKLPANYQVPLEKLLAELPVAVFTASDSLGWVYQFWQADNKDRINDSEVKIGARELSAVTQLFTEPYMVSFLLDNALGAWWANKRLSEQDLRNAASEDELRRKAAIPGVSLSYLRFVREADAEGIERWTPAAGTFPGWPENLGDLKCLDPCCGSGHFLVSLLLMLVPLRMELEGLDARAAVDAVLRENIHGLELDARCVELAAFALALTAWRYPDAGGYRPLPEIQVACSGLSISSKKSQWLALAPSNEGAQAALGALYEQFEAAPILGSLISTTYGQKDLPLFVSGWQEVRPVLEKVLADDSDTESTEVTVVALGLLSAAKLLSQQYSWVATNVPFKNSGGMSDEWKRFADKNFPNTNKELASVFHERIMQLVGPYGAASLVAPQGLLYKDYHSKYRQWLLTRKSIALLCTLGASAFSEVTGEEVTTSLSITLGSLPGQFETRLINASGSEIASKMDRLMSGTIGSIRQSKYVNKKTKNLISVAEFDTSEELLSVIASHNLGICTGDGARFYRYVWECPRGSRWNFIQGTTDSTAAFSGMHSLVNLGGDDSSLIDYVSEKLGEDRVGSWIRGGNAWNKPGVLISATGDLKVSLFMGTYFDENTVALSCDGDNLSTLWSITSSISYNGMIRSFDDSLKVRGALVRCRVDMKAWKKIGIETFPKGLPSPYTSDPTQWIFHGHPSGSVIWDETVKWTAHGPLRTDDTVLHVAVARLLGYRWPTELDPGMELAAEQREWVNRCETLLPFADSDGIVCIPPVRGEAPADQRLRNLLAAAYGPAWSSAVESQLLASVEHAGKSLETWLREKFFAQHCKLFEQRPFIWHIWDGLADGFAVLVNYHQLDRKNLETLIYTYLGDWISRQKQDVSSCIDGAQEKLAAAEALKQRLELVLKGDAPFDIFVRWKPLAEQPIGWDPDLNDGVRLNIRPFLSVPDIKKKGAGVLRDKPSIKWDKDRGKDVESAPWYPIFDGERINDHHLDLKDKIKAREQRGG